MISEIQIDISYVEKTGSVFPDSEGKKLSSVNNLPLQSVMKSDSFCFGVDFLVIY